MTAARLLLCAGMTGALAAQPRTTSLQLAEGHSLLVALRADVDGDGLTDLGIARREGAAAAKGKRRLAVHLQRKDGAPFVAAPDREFELSDDVVAAGFADFDAAHPGAELLLITPRVIASLAAPDASPKPLGQIELLFQPGHDRQLGDAQAWLRDLDGDGLCDVLLPEPNGYRAGLQRRSEAGTTLLLDPLRLPPRPEATTPSLRARADMRRGERVTIRLDGDEPQLPLLAANAACPRPRVIDFDGDGRLDVVALDRPRLSVFAPNADRRFGAVTFLDVKDAAPARLIEPGFFAELCDFDADRKPELVLCRTEASEGQGYQTSVDILPHPFERARSHLRLQGLVALPQFDDVDGDGTPDLTVGSLRTDSMAALQGSSEDIEAQLTVFLTRNGKPKLPAALAWRTMVSPRTARSQRAVTANFVGDVDGDGVNDLLFQDADRSVQVWKATRRGDSLQLTPFWQTKLPENSRQLQRLAHQPCDDIVIGSERELLHVRLR